LRKRNLNLHAGVEDRVNRELTYVANASMAVRLAGWLNDAARDARYARVAAPGRSC
jgi:hypothetical protein